MRTRLRVLKSLLVIGLSSNACFAQSASKNEINVHNKKSCCHHVAATASNPIELRTMQEQKVPRFYGIAFYKPTYALPYYYTGSPDNVVYQKNTPNNEKLNHSEFKYQISLKVPVWKNILHHPSSLFFAYTQQSYWQLYNTKKFFRESDYEPEVFLANNLNRRLFKDWGIDFLNVGVSHQSNGYGDSLERSWNRIYLEAITTTGNWMISVKPWYVLSTNAKNDNITNYLGYGRLLVAYKAHTHVISLQAHNFIEGKARRATGEITWSFPLTCYLKGYVQVFSGYGQSLTEYDHRTNSAGIGLALNDWI